MSVTILNVLCEGQTEERFVKEVLKPYLKDYGVIVKNRLLVTSKKKNAAGGMLSYTQVKNDLTKWIKEVARNKGEKHFFTTMFDYYALPNDFPGFAESQLQTDKYNVIKTIEESFVKDINCGSFTPYIQLHEFESLVFCDLDKLLIEYPSCIKEINDLKKGLENCDNNPEMVNSGPYTAPSKRIKKALEKKYKYNKPMSGTTVTKAIGVGKLKSKCKHFNEWLEKLEMLSESH